MAEQVEAGDRIPADRVPADQLLRVIRAAFQRRGLSATHADYVAQGLVEPSLKGIDTHGVALLETYLLEIEGGRARAQPELTWREAGTAGRMLDAGGALGLVAGREACAAAVAVAREHGVALAAGDYSVGVKYTQAGRAGSLGRAMDARTRRRVRLTAGQTTEVVLDVPRPSEVRGRVSRG